MEITLKQVDKAIMTFQYMRTRHPYNKEQEEAITLAQHVLIDVSSYYHKQEDHDNTD